MIYKDLITSLIRRFKNIDETDVNTREVVGSYLNLSYKEVYRAHHWEYRKSGSDLVLIPNYETGTCTVTQYNGTNETDAKTVTFSGSSLNRAMEGRYFQPQSDGNWYRINRISGSTAYLDSPVVRTSAGSLTFKIWKRLYFLHSEVDILLDFGKWDGDGKLTFRSNNDLTDAVSNISSEDSPDTFTQYGIDEYWTDYETGTIAISKDNNVVTGSGGTEWMRYVGRGDILESGAHVFRVKRAETDSRILLYNYAPEEVGAGSTYKIKKDNALGFQFYSNADDYRVLRYSYFKHGYNMVNENYDRPQLPEEFDIAILSRAEAMIRKDKEDSGWVNVQNLYNAELEGLKMKVRVANPRYRQFAPKIPSYMPGRSS